MATSTIPLAKSSTLSQYSGGLKLAQFWRWWSRELAEAMPATFRQAMVSEPQNVDVACDNAGATWLKANVNSMTEIKHISFVAEGQVSQTALRDMLRGQGSEVRLVLDDKTALVKAISLPLATEENLRDVIAFDMDRQTPFKASQVYFDCKVLKRDSANGLLHAKLAVVPRDSADRSMRMLRDAGFAVTAIGVRDDISGSAPYLDLLPIEQRPPRQLSSRQIFNRVLLALVALMALVAIGLPIWQKREMVKTLIPELEKARAESLISEKVMDEYNAVAEQYDFAMRKKQTTCPVVDLIEEFSKSLPDNTWVQSFEVKPVANKAHEITILGETQSASKLIEIVDRSPMLQNPRQTGNVVRAQTPGLERYQISAEIKPRPLPQIAQKITLPAAKVVSKDAAKLIPPSATATPAPASAPAPATKPAVTPPGAASIPAKTVASAKAEGKPTETGSPKLAVKK